ncbi:MAG: ATPase domain-containing protein [Xanthobacteraceae bacterium]
MAETATAPNAKISTGIAGFDAMTGGGLPRGRVSAIIGTAGAGKTVFAMQTLIHRVKETGGTGVFVSFEQSVPGVLADMTSFAWDAGPLIDAGRIVVFDGRPRADILLSGAFDIAGLLAAVEGACGDAPPACVVFDGIDTLLTMLPTPGAQRGELLRLQDHVHRLGGSVLLTVKASSLADSSFESLALYMADCVVELERAFEDGLSSRRLRIQKYRSSSHAESRFPLVMTSRGVEVELVDTAEQELPISGERLSTGIERLDAMLTGGYFRGSSTLLSGAPGTAKTTLGTRFLEAVCRRGERALGIFFDEAPEEVLRNIASVGTDLAVHRAAGMLRMHGMADRTGGPDEFVHEIIGQIIAHRPQHLLVDPISVFTASTVSQSAVRRLVQFCKRQGITIVLTSLVERNAVDSENSRSYVSTLCDNWIHLSYVVHGGERNRALTIVKSRGTAHSNQVGELLLSDDGITIADVYTEEGVVLMGSLRWQKERAGAIAVHEAEAAAAQHYRDVERAADDIARRIANLNAELAEKQQELTRFRDRATEMEERQTEGRSGIARLRRARDADLSSAPNDGGEGRGS